jgi:hypothetical protein
MSLAYLIHLDQVPTINILPFFTTAFNSLWYSSESRDTILTRPATNQVLCPRLQELEAALLVFDTRYVRAEDFVEDDLPHKPGGDALPQAASHSLSCPTQGSMDMQSRFAIFTRGEHTHPHHLMCSVNGQEHGLRRHFPRTPWADNDIATPNSTHQDSLSHRYSILFGKTLDTFGHHITILQPYHENPANSSFTCFHYEPPLQFQAEF